MHIVKVDGLHLHAGLGVNHLEVVEVVETDFVPPGGPVAAGVDGAGVRRVLTHIVDVVVFNDLVIAAVTHCKVRRVVNFVVACTVANTLKADTRGVGGLNTGETLDLIVLRHVIARCQGSPVAAA